MYRYREHRLEAGAPVAVLGIVRETPERTRLVSPLIVSNTSDFTE